MAVFFASQNLRAHCEIPCGIYDDELRAKLIEEHAGTIKKSMETIVSLQKQTPVDYNQLVRWIANKDDHAEKIQHLVTQYFMTQRIKPGTPQYDVRLKALHEILIYAMKCKQTTDVQNVTALLRSLSRFKKSYFAHQHGVSKPDKKKSAKDAKKH
jgi:nickel superoxide dismutase